MADDFGAFGDWEDDAEFDAAWARADAEAALVLSRALGAEDSVPPSPAEVDLAGLRLAEAIRAKTPEGDYFRFACGWDSGLPGTFGLTVWLYAARATISPPEDPQTTPEDQAAVASLQHADWLALVVGLVRRGVGAEATAEAWVADLHGLPDLIDIEQEDPDDDWAFESALGVLVPLWQTLGILDDRQRLTTLGCWGLPMALARVWLPEPAGPVLDESQAVTVLSLLAQAPSNYADLRQQAAKHGVFADEETLRRSLQWRLEVYECADAGLVHVPSLVRDCVLTHRVTEEERATGLLGLADLDLWGLLALDGLPLGTGGELKTVFHGDEPELPDEATSALRGPDGWLDPFAPGSLLGMRYVDDAFTVEPVEEAAELPEVTAALVAAAYDVLAWPDAPELPPDPGAALEDVVIAALRADPHVLARPVRPLTELLHEAGFEVRGNRFGEPGTAWYGEPEWLDPDQRTAYRTWAQACAELLRDRPPEHPEGVVAALAAGGQLVVALAAHDVTLDPELARLAELGTPASAGTERAVGLYLQSRAEESLRDGRAWRELVEAAVEADPAFGPALEDLADIAALRGDAGAAERLYVAAGVPADAPVRRRLQEFLKPPPGDIGRNQPCPCGSGRKFKLCHGRTAVHPLPARASWLWHKLREFAQRPVNRHTMLEWAGLLEEREPDHPDSVRRAMGDDDTTLDFAVFDGGLAEDFAELYADLLPADELALVESWLTAPLRLLEVQRTTLLAVRCRDLVTGEGLELHDTTLARSVEVADLVLGRPLEVGDGRLRLWAGPLGIPRTMRPRLLALLRSDPEPELVAAWFGAARRPPTLQTTHGQELVMCEARYAVTDVAAAWVALAALGEPDELDGDELVVLSDDDNPIVLGSVTRRGDGVTIETHAVERLRDLQARLRDLVPEATLVSESTRPIADLLAEHGGDPSAVAAALGRGLPGPGSADVPLPPDAVDEIVRRQEASWLDGPIPALGGLTPREAAADAAARPELEALLEDYAWSDRRHSSPLTMDLARLRRELGLT